MFILTPILESDCLKKGGRFFYFLKPRREGRTFRLQVRLTYNQTSKPVALLIDCGIHAFAKANLNNINYTKTAALKKTAVLYENGMVLIVHCSEEFLVISCLLDAL